MKLLRPLVLALVGAAVAWTLPALAGPQGQTWHSSLKDGLAAAKRRERPVLAVTIWRPEVCRSCDTWRERVRTFDAVRRQYPRFELVEWRYDGLSGKIIPWTLDNGGISEDPAVQAFVLGLDGKVIARCADRTTFTPDGFARWLDLQAATYERAHPRLAVAVQRACLLVKPDGTGRTIALPDLDDAAAAGRRSLVFVGRESALSESKAHLAEVKATARYESKILDTDAVARAVEGWALFRLDLAEPDHAAYAARLGIEAAPALLAFVPGEDAPQVLPVKANANTLAFQLKKLR